MILKPGNEKKKIIWVDSEVHLLPPEFCNSDYYPPPEETMMRKTIYEHPERENALPRAVVEKLLVQMESAHIDMAVIMGLPWQDPVMNWRNNSYIAEIVRQNPGSFIGAGVLPPPRGRDIRDDVRRIVEEYGLKGIKVIPSWQGFRLDEKIFEPAIREIIDNGIVLIPHTDHLYRPHEQADMACSLYEIGRRFPELKILAPHLGGLLCLYALHHTLKQALHNMLFVTSVPATMQMIKFALDAVGADQLAFGTDYPFNPSHDQITVRKAFEELMLPEKEMRLISGLNILKLFGEIQ